MDRTLLCVLGFALAAGTVSFAGSESLVPFVIPARADPNSPLAVRSFKPIHANDRRLIAREGHFYHYGGGRARLWGVNLSFGANLPTHADAPVVAERLAAAGVNTVRCHHMDTSSWPRGIWDAKDPKRLSTEALDRLDYFVAQLAQRGIYVNLNLHVGREHSRYLGLAQSNTKYDKIVGIFTPGMVQAQRQYARDLLDRPNPYRLGVRYADDPAIAIVEITNEDSFFMWSGDQDLRGLPPFYAGLLQGQFNSWLRGRYATDADMGTAWSKDSEPLGGNVLANSTLTLAGHQVPERWNLEQHSGCKAGLSGQSYAGREALRVDIDQANATQWHLQLNQGQVRLEAGHYYTVVLEAAAPKARRINCSVGQAHDPWANLGLSRQLDLTGVWQRFELGFTASMTDANARVNLAFSGDAATFYVASVEIRPGGQVGLGKGESARRGTVRLFQDNESKARLADRLIFLAETERAYFAGMRAFIREDLGCQALVTGTIVFGALGLWAQQDMDFIDTHAYWQHPHFPGRPWDPANWTVEQKAMTDHRDQATILGLACSRLADKPFTLSEYNHPAPLDSQAECVPLIASFAAAQDWDGVWLYTYSHTSDSWDRETLNSFFDIDTNPAKWGFMRSGTAIFREAGIPRLGDGEIRSLGAMQDLASLQDRFGRDLFGMLSSILKMQGQHLLETCYCVTLEPVQKMAATDPQVKCLAWTVDDDGRGLYAATGSRAWVYIGHASGFNGRTGGRVTIEGPEFVALTLVSLDGMSLDHSSSLLVTACGHCENTGMVFSADRRTVGTQWGKAPVRIEQVTGRVRLPEGPWTAEALGPDGMPKAQARVDTDAAGQAVLHLSDDDGTMWYLLRR